MYILPFTLSCLIRYSHVSLGLTSLDPPLLKFFLHTYGPSSLTTTVVRFRSPFCMLILHPSRSLNNPVHSATLAPGIAKATWSSGSYDCPLYLRNLNFVSNESKILIRGSRFAIFPFLKMGLLKHKNTGIEKRAFDFALIKTREGGL